MKVITIHEMTRISEATRKGAAFVSVIRILSPDFVDRRYRRSMSLALARWVPAVRRLGSSSSLLAFEEEDPAADTTAKADFHSVFA